MGFNNDEDDEALRRALAASLEDMKNEQLSDIEDEDIEQLSDIEVENEDIEQLSDIEVEDIEQLNDIEDSNNINTNTNDDAITIAIQSSLIEYQTTEEELLNEILIKSLITIEEDKKYTLQKEIELQEEEDTILAQTIDESYMSNVSVQMNSVVNNDNDYEEQEYMRMIIQQIKENEERDDKLKQTKQTRSLIEEQDFEYEETLRQDISKEKEKEKIKIKAQLTNIEKIENSNYEEEEEEEENKEEIQEIQEIPKTLDDIRKARLAFFEKK